MRMTTASSTMRTRFPDTAACTPSGQPAVSPLGLPLVDELHDSSVLLGFEPVEPQTKRELFGCFDVPGPRGVPEQYERRCRCADREAGLDVGSLLHLTV